MAIIAMNRPKWEEPNGLQDGFSKRILTSLSLEEVAAGSYRHIPINSKRVYRGGVLTPSQATTYARSNFELPCGELLVEGGPFSLAVSITVLPLLSRMVRSAHVH